MAVLLVGFIVGVGVGWAGYEVLDDHYRLRRAHDHRLPVEIIER